MGWLAHINRPFPNTSFRPPGEVGLVSVRLGLISVGCVAFSVAAGPLGGVKLESALVSPEPDLFTFFSRRREQANGIGGHINRRFQLCYGRIPVHPGSQVQKMPIERTAILSFLQNTEYFCQRKERFVFSQNTQQYCAKESGSRPGECEPLGNILSWSTA
jgi:hypothetical protein